jgi:hypothetical protein
LISGEDIMRRVIGVYTIGVILVFMVSVFVRFFAQHVLVNRLDIHNGFTRFILNESADEPAESPAPDINWKALYPFQEDDPLPPPVGATIPETFNRWIGIIKGKIEQNTKDRLMARIKLIEAASWYEAVIGWDLLNAESEPMLDMGDGYLVNLSPKKNVQPLVDSMYELNNTLSEMDVDFLYVQCPHKISRDDRIAGVFDFSNENIDTLLSALSEKNIPFLDLRKSLRDDKLDYRGLFFKTDHHWTEEAGLWAVKKISGYLNEHNTFAIDLSLLAPDRYRREVYENYFLGSWGRRITLARSRPEDIVFLYPLFDTDISLRIPSRNINKRGSFEVFYSFEQLKTIDYYNLNPYGAYSHGVNALLAAKNNLLHSGKKALLIADSFGVVVSPFLSLAIENVETLDLRLFTGSVKTFVEKTRPDAVIVLYSADSFTDSHLVDLR